MSVLLTWISAVAETTWGHVFVIGSGVTSPRNEIDIMLRC